MYAMWLRLQHLQMKIIIFSLGLVSNEIFFFKLVKSNICDHLVFYCREVVNQYIKNIFILLFQRLSSSKTTKFIKSK